MTEETIGQQISRRRVALGLSRRDFAGRAGIDRMTLTRIETDDPGTRDITVSAVLNTLSTLERGESDGVIRAVVERPDGTRATFESQSAEAVARAARLFAREEER